MRSVHAAMITALSLCACAHSTATQPSTSNPGEMVASAAPIPQGSVWRLVAWPGHAIPQPPQGAIPTLEFHASGQASGALPCNAFSASYTLDGGSLRFGPLMSSKRACPALAAEQALVQELARVDRFERGRAQLLLRGAGVELDYELLGIDSGRTRVIEIAPQTRPCSGVGPMQCLQWREAADQPWQLLHGGIIGFEHQAGTSYALRVRELELPDPPADAPARRWMLDAMLRQAREPAP